MTEKTIVQQAEYDDINLWFDGLIQKIRTDYLMISEEVAPSDVTEVYNLLMEGDERKIHEYGRTESTRFFIKSIIHTYFQGFLKLEKKPERLAIHLTNAKILLWAEIVDDEWDVERNLYLLESKVNSGFQQYGFHIDTFIVEKSDERDVPEHYQQLYP